MRAAALGAAAVLLCVGGCSRHTRNVGATAARSAAHDLGRAAAGLKQGIAPIRHDLTRVSDRAEASSRHLLKQAGAQVARFRH